MSAEEKANGAFSLINILHGDQAMQQAAEKDAPASAWDDEAESNEKAVVQGFCIECEDQPAQTYCVTCADEFCDVCFAAQHRKGSRKRHATRTLSEQAEKKAKVALDSAHTAAPAGGNGVDASASAHSLDAEGADEDMNSDSEPEQLADAGSSELSKSSIVLGSQPALGAPVGEWFVERSKFIPLRLGLSERKFLRLLEAALHVSEYTDKIDTIGYGLSKAKRIVQQIKELCAIMSGLVVAADYKQGQELFSDRDFQANSEFYQDIFELGRRHKIMNPDKMRTTYGKLVYLLQDSQNPDVKDLLNFSCVRPIKTVHSLLEAQGVVDLLRDDLVTQATKEIYAEGRSRREVQRDIKAKERAIETLAARYERKGLSQESVRQCLYSIGDNHAFLRVNRDPCVRMIEYLTQYFNPTQAGRDENGSLAIRSGRGGARLSHDHAKQYAYVLQSLTLWREILHDMFHLWSLAEQDLLSETTRYRLMDTGQGLNRVQAAPKTSRLMHIILNRAQQSIGSWVGSSVIHMGDHNVPNSLTFIDKYSQIYRILLPICNTLSKIPTLTSPALTAYIKSEFGSVDDLYRTILGDFFRHGFDGSGADNFFDAGSCIDGRLTSAWNWCSQIEKKKYFPVFLLTGFVGFDGEW